MRPSDRQIRIAPGIARLAFYAVIASFVAFVAINLYLGGDALNGYQRSGRFFVCAHGSCNEVSRSIWRYSYWHAVSALSGIFLALVGTAAYKNRKHLW